MAAKTLSAWRNAVATLLRYYVRDEYGTFKSGRMSYNQACILASDSRLRDRCDYFVVDTRTGRAVSEVYGFKE